MTETEAKKLLLDNHSKDRLRSMYKRGIKTIRVPIITGSALFGGYQNHGEWNFHIIELLNDM